MSPKKVENLFDSAYTLAVRGCLVSTGSFVRYVRVEAPVAS